MDINLVVVALVQGHLSVNMMTENSVRNPIKIAQSVLALATPMNRQTHRTFNYVRF